MTWECRCGKRYVYEGWLRRHMLSDEHYEASRGNETLTLQIKNGWKFWVNDVVMSAERPGIFSREGLVMIP